MRDENKIKMIDSEESFKIKEMLNKQILGQKIKELILAKYTSLYKFAQYSGFNYDRVKKWAAGKICRYEMNFVYCRSFLMSRWSI